MNPCPRALRPLSARCLRRLTSVPPAHLAGEHISLKPTELPGVSALELHRPSHRNALSRAAVGELAACVAAARACPPRALLVTSTDARAFCAGADLKERRGLPDDAARATTARLRGALCALAALPAPTVAVVEGAARGGGFELALACDVRVAGPRASFALPEATLGIIPGAGGTQRLPRAVGAPAALEIMWSGRAVAAQEARALGIVQWACEEDGQARARALEVARSFAKAAPGAVALVKAAVQEGAGESIEQALEIEWAKYVQTFGTPEREEGVRAFNDGRAPRF